MAQKVTIVLVDDIDGGKADETVVFGLDGRTYELDLSTKNAAKLRDLLSPYVASARKQSATRTRATGAGRGRRGNSPDPAVVRAWARSKKIEVSERGRISADVIAKYEAAQG
jgi:hypothetical protein